MLVPARHPADSLSLTCAAFSTQEGMGGGMPGWTNQGRGVFVDELVADFEPRVRSYEQVGFAADVYRHALEMADDSSVTVVCVGHATNLVELLLSGPDDASPLSGYELAARKVCTTYFLPPTSCPPTSTSC